MGTESGTPGASAGDAGAQGAPSIDLSNPAVQAAIQNAVTQARGAWEKDVETGLKKNRDDLLEESKPWKALGKKPDEVAAALKRLEDLETAGVAAGIGADPKKFEEAVESRAQAKYKAKEDELAGVMSQKDTRIAELEKALAAAQDDAHTNFVAAELVRAAMPEDLRIVHDEAWPYLIDQLKSVTVAQKVDGLPRPVARLKVNGALVPGTGPDSLMTYRELLPLARSGKGPIPTLGFCFVSAGQGSDTTNPKNGGGAEKPWGKMTDAEQTAYIRDNGKEKAKAKIAADSAAA